MSWNSRAASGGAIEWTRAGKKTESSLIFVKVLLQMHGLPIFASTLGSSGRTGPEPARPRVPMNFTWTNPRRHRAGSPLDSSKRGVLRARLGRAAMPNRWQRSLKSGTFA